MIYALFIIKMCTLFIGATACAMLMARRGRQRPPEMLFAKRALLAGLVDSLSHVTVNDTPLQIGSAARRERRDRSAHDAIALRAERPRLAASIVSVYHVPVCNYACPTRSLRLPFLQTDHSFRQTHSNHALTNENLHAN